MEQNFYNSFDKYPNPEQPEQGGRARKKAAGGGRVAALVIAAALLAGVGGGAITAALINDVDVDTVAQSMSNQEGTPASQQQVNEVMLPLSSGVDGAPLETTTNTGDKLYTPSEVYANYVDAVVAISVESTVTNVFGQVSSSASSGSGFIITDDGYVATNYHVIADGTHISVMLYDGSSYDATVVGFDASNDVALLKIEASGLKTVAIGDSDRIQVGEQVCAIGNPLGELTFTLTSGYVSALDREINTDGTPINMFQTDAAINPGNSGGPLFDMAGNVIGITTAKYASDEIEGLGFVIPINDVMEIVNDLKMYGRVVGRAYLGVTVSDIADASMYNLPQGAYIVTVTEGSCAETAGIIAGDIVTGIGNEVIESYSDLVAALRDFEAGDTTTITVFQSGAYKELVITFDEKPADTEQTTTTQPESNGGYTDPFGFGSSPFPGYGYGYGYGNGG